MRLTLTGKPTDRIPFGAIYGILVLCAISILHFLPIHHLLPVCPFKGLTGFSCPTCGTTRALMHIAAGNVAAALSLNPLTCLAVIALLSWMIVDLVPVVFRTRHVRLAASRSEAELLRIAAVLAFLGNWAYLIVQQI